MLTSAARHFPQAPGLAPTQRGLFPLVASFPANVDSPAAIQTGPGAKASSLAPGPIFFRQPGTFGTAAKAQSRAPWKCRGEQAMELLRQNATVHLMLLKSPVVRPALRPPLLPSNSYSWCAQAIKEYRNTLSFSGPATVGEGPFVLWPIFESQDGRANAGARTPRRCQGSGVVVGDSVTKELARGGFNPSRRTVEFMVHYHWRWECAWWLTMRARAIFVSPAVQDEISTRVFKAIPGSFCPGVETSSLVRVILGLSVHGMQLSSIKYVTVLPLDSDLPFLYAVLAGGHKERNVLV